MAKEYWNREMSAEQVKQHQRTKNDPRQGEYEKAHPEWQRDFTKSEKRMYGDLMRDWRAKHGLVDGLRTDQSGFNAYLKKRREADAKSRPGR